MESLGRRSSDLQYPGLCAPMESHITSCGHRRVPVGVSNAGG
jgi:hypothetical protein